MVLLWEIGKKMIYYFELVKPIKYEEFKWFLRRFKKRYIAKYFIVTFFNRTQKEKCHIKLFNAFEGIINS